DLIQGNLIGVGADGVTALGNTVNGIGINISSTGNVTHATIGGLAPGAGNVIAFNGQDGIQTRQPMGDNAILSNSIHDNFLLGITYGLDNIVILNERPLNGVQIKYPVLRSAQSDNAQTTISGQLDSLPNATYLLQFFSNTTVDASGFGEGEKLIGS